MNMIYLKKAVPIILVILLLTLAVFYGLPHFDILGSQGTTTESYTILNDWKGNAREELIVGRKGFILSFRDDAYSEQISIQGTVTAVSAFSGLFSTSVISKLKYVVYVGQNGAWKKVLSPDYVAPYIHLLQGQTEYDTGRIDVSSGSTYYAKTLSFEIKGNPFNSDVTGLRVEFYAYSKENVFNPFEEFKWRLLSSDQAYLYCGKSSIKVEGTRNTFEIGETVRLHVTTSAGGRTVGENVDRTWIIKLYRPDGTEDTNHNFPKYLPDWYDGIVELKITPDMWNPQRSNTWQFKLYNTLLEKGTLSFDTIDVKAKAPGNVSIKTSCSLVALEDEEITVTLTSTINPQTQLPIQYFKVWIWYGTSTDLMPPSNSDRWIKREELISAYQSGSTTYTGSFTFTPQYGDRWVTIAAKAYDTENRASLAMKYYQLYVNKKGTPAPSEEEVEEQGGGSGNYTGGSTEETLPGGFGNDIFNKASSGDMSAIFLIVIGIMILVMSILIAFIAPVHPYIKIVIVLAGFMITLLVWWLL